MLGVFFLPAFTGLGHECQDLLSQCHGMHLCTDWTSVYTLGKRCFFGFFWNGLRTHVKSKKIIHSTGKSSEED